MEPRAEHDLNKNPRNFEPLADGRARSDINTDIHSSVGRSDSDSWRFMLEKLYDDMGRLWQKESELIRVEMNEKLTQVKAAAVSMVAGGAVLFVGLLCVAATAIIALNLITELWLAAVIVTAAFLIVGGIMVGGAKQKLEADSLKPRRSVETLGEIKTTLKERVHEFKH
jgi:uncharacterized membrane protein YqjE